ncbi:MAG: hypothetical protein HYX88_02435, partial [Chloroflexi bacterium]|nr:hypothetical protein [Chloroflexota bacterium]
MHAIAYVVSSELLQEFFQKRDYQEIEVVVGENLTEPVLRQELQNKPVEVVEALAKRVEDGSLRMLVSRRSIHTKLYMLEKPGVVRLIQTSANLTETARKASQVNYAWYTDLPTDDDFVARVLQDYRAHAKGCSVFMGDLVDLFKVHDGTSRRELVEVWVKGEVVRSPESETVNLFHEISIQSLLLPSEREADIITVSLPEAPAARKEIEHLLKPLAPTITSNALVISPSVYVNYVHTAYGVPLMRVDLGRRELRLGLKGSIACLSEPLPDARTVDRDLEHIELYIRTVDLGKSPDRVFAKASMFEAGMKIPTPCAPLGCGRLQGNGIPQGLQAVDQAPLDALFIP